MSTTPDIVTITCIRPSLNQTITVTVPEGVVQMLDYLSANTLVADSVNPRQMKKKYMYGMNVIWVDVMANLLPMWQDTFIGMLLQAQLKPAQDKLRAQVQQGVDDIVVVGP